MTIENQQSRQIVALNESGTSLYAKTQSDGSDHKRIKVGGGSISEPYSATQANQYSQHIAESPQKTDSPTFSIRDTDDLRQKLEVQTRISQRLNDNERRMIETMKIKDQQVLDMQSLVV